MSGTASKAAHSTRYGLSGKRVYVAGHRGMVGSALVRRLANEDCQILTAERRSLDLMRAEEVSAFFKQHRPQAVFVAAAKVGGIIANNALPAEFLYNNLMIAANITRGAHESAVEKMLFLGSSCIYPREAVQPIPESALLSGPLEPTNEGYAIAKIAGIKLMQAYRCQYGCDYISAMPANLYGPGDNYDLLTSHVVPALIRKAHEAKIRGEPSFVIWGTGSPRREFLHVDDCADALVHIMKHYSGSEHINVGSGSDLSIADLAILIASIVGFKGTITYDTEKPDGTPRKLMCGDRLKALGWEPRISLEAGLANAYSAFLVHENSAPPGH